MAEALFNPGLPIVEEVVETIEPVAEVNAAEVPPVVETPAAVIEEPVATEPSVVETPTAVEVIKEVEKIVEKYPEMDEHQSAIFNALMDGKEDVLLAYLSEKNRDYKGMSDYDVVKANMQKANPNWSAEDLDLKIEVQYGDLAKIDLNKINAEAEPEEYAAAEAHNKAVERNAKLLKLDAIEARTNLEAAKRDIKLPRTEQVTAQPIDNTPSPEAIAQAKQDWHKQVDEQLTTLNDFTFKVGDKDNGYEDVTYQVAPTQKVEINTFLKEADGNKILSRLGWVDANGKQNIAKIAGDALKLENLQQLVSSAYTQGKTAGTKSTVAEIKNIDLSQNNSSTVAAVPQDIGALAFGHLNPK